MDDLISGFILMWLAVMAIALAVMAAIAVFVAGAAIGALISFTQGTFKFVATLGRSVITRGAGDRSPKDPEPAFQLYVLGQLKDDLRRAFTVSWDEMQGFRQSLEGFADSIEWAPLTPLSYGIIAGGAIGPFIGASIGLVISIPVLVIAGIMIAGAWLLVMTLRGIESLRQRVRKTAYECPEDHERFPLPIYLCPSCGARHERLVPGRWGIFKRECECGEVALPTMVINGRQKVPQTCPSGHPMSGLIGYAQPLRLALVAGPSAGKTTYLAAAMMQLEEMGGDKQLAVDVVKESRAAYQQLTAGLKSGRLPAKTQTANAALIAEVQATKRSRVMHAYDVAGEHYGDSSGVSNLRFLEVPSGIVFLIDPLSIPHVAEEHADELEQSTDAVRPSPEDPLRVIERTISALVETGAKPEDLPVAVVVGKADAFGIDAEISALGNGGGAEAPRRWLEQNGAGNLVRSLEHEFGTVGWFAASALGRLPSDQDGSAFEPRGAVEPMLWLMERNGIRPAEAPFEPSRSAEKLASTDASSLPAIGSGGWAWRGAASMLSVSAILALAGIAVAQVAREGDFSDGGGGSASATPADFGGSGESGSSSGDATSVTEPDDAPAPEVASTAPDPASPEGVLLRHFEAINDGDPSAAWNLLHPDYRAAQGGWVNEREQTDARIDVREISRIGSDGPDVMRLDAEIVAADTAGPEAGVCRLFSGWVRMQRSGGQWRYRPGTINGVKPEFSESARTLNADPRCDPVLD